MVFVGVALNDLGLSADALRRAVAARHATGRLAVNLDQAGVVGVRAERALNGPLGPLGMEGILVGADEQRLTAFGAAKFVTDVIVPFVDNLGARDVIH